MFHIFANPYNTRGQIITTKAKHYAKWLKIISKSGSQNLELPISIKDTEHVSEFKYRLNEWSGPVCKCGSCELCKFSNIWNVLCLKLLILYASMISLLWRCVDMLIILYSCICVYIYVYMCLHQFLCKHRYRCVCMCVHWCSHSHSCLYIFILKIIRRLTALD